MNTSIKKQFYWAFVTLALTASSSQAMNIFGTTQAGKKFMKKTAETRLHIVLQENAGVIERTYKDKSKKIFTGGLVGCSAVMLYLRNAEHHQKILLTHYSRGSEEAHFANFVRQLEELKQANPSEYTYGRCLIILPTYSGLPASKGLKEFQEAYAQLNLAEFDRLIEMPDFFKALRLGSKNDDLVTDTEYTDTEYVELLHNSKNKELFEAFKKALQKINMGVTEIQLVPYDVKPHILGTQDTSIEAELADGPYAQCLIQGHWQDEKIDLEHRHNPRTEELSADMTATDKAILAMLICSIVGMMVIHYCKETNSPTP